MAAGCEEAHVNIADLSYVEKHIYNTCSIPG